MTVAPADEDAHRAGRATALSRTWTSLLNGAVVFAALTTAYAALVGPARSVPARRGRGPAPTTPGPATPDPAIPDPAAARPAPRGRADPGRPRDPNRLGHGRAGQDRQPTAEHAERGTASKRIIVGYGFWIFLLSDIIMFSAFFATYAVLKGETAGGPSGRDLFDLKRVGIETACLLLSSFTCGLATLGAQAQRRSWFYGAMAATFVLGAAFLGFEVLEFTGMVAQGAGPTRSAFLSAFFALVGLHGFHVTAGLMWLLTMMAQVYAKGYRPDILRRVLCFSLFWHALDIVWVALFTVVYLMGAGR